MQLGVPSYIVWYQATLFGTCTLEPAGLISMFGMVSLVTSDLDFDYHSLHLSFVSEDSYLVEPIGLPRFIRCLDSVAT